MQTIEAVVEAKSKYGVKIGAEWFNTQNLTMLDALQRGVSYKIEYERTPKGRNEIKSVVPANGSAAPAPAAAPKQTYGNSPEDKVRISRAGVIQAAVQSSLVKTAQESIDLALTMLDFVNQEGAFKK
jgi:hypothetical protein